MTEIAFTKVKLPYGWMANMSPHKVHFDGKEWRTAEHLFQALRLKPHTSVGYIDVWREKTPMNAKRIAKNYIQDLNLQHITLTEDDVMLMRETIALKLESNPHLWDELESTGNAPIYEDVSKRIGDCNSSSLFWGAAFIQNKFWIGKNWLGKIWMEERYNKFYSDKSYKLFMKYD